MQMASFEVAYNFMMDNEDAARACANVPDVGGSAIAGVNSKDWPVQFQKIANTPQDQRGPLVEQFYQMHFWNDWFDDLTSDEVAKRVFDASVNMGSVAAVRCLQQACNSLKRTDPSGLPTEFHLHVDGELGQDTVNAANATDSAALVGAFQHHRVAYYDDLIAKNPALAIYKDAWTARAEK
jgi:lysozyme family protein